MNTVSIKAVSARLSSRCFNKIGIALLSLSFTHLIVAAPNTSQTRHDHHLHSQIIQQAENFIKQQIDDKAYSRVEISMGTLDPRLRLEQCSQPLTAKLAPGSRLVGKASIHVKCPGQKLWTVFINSQIKLFKPVVYSARPLRREHILRKQDLMTRETELSQLQQGYYTNIDDLIGMQLKRRLPQQQLLKVNHVKPATLIKRGEVVSIIAENSQYSVKMSGKAMMDGAKGDRIRVKNLSSKRIIEGFVKASGTVSIY